MAVIEMSGAAINGVAHDTPAASTERAGKYLTFQLGREVYGLPVLRVREVIGMQSAAKVPHSPEFVQGVINLRGKVIPIIDLRRKFGLPRTEHTDRTCIIVVQKTSNGSTILAGAVVDFVAEVVTLASADIENTPDFGDGKTLPHLMGIAKTKDGVRILVDPDVLFDMTQMVQTDTVLARPGGEE